MSIQLSRSGRHGQAAPRRSRSWMVSLARWQTLIFATMIFMVFEGAFRKWLFPSQQMLIYFIKDGLILLALVLFLASRERRVLPPSFPTMLNGLIAVAAFYFIVQIFNPSSPSILVGIIGYKNYMLYIAVLYMAPYLFEDAQDMEDKFRKYMILMIPVALLGLAQFASPQNSFINVYVQHDPGADMHVSTFGGGRDSRVRASGTFSYIGGFATFVIAMYHLSLAFVLASNTSGRTQRVAQVLLVAVSLAVLTTGSRTAFVSTFIVTPLVLILCMASGVKVGRLALRVVIGAFLIGVAILAFGGDALSSFLFRAQNSDSNLGRSLSVFTEWQNAADAAPFIGMGIGTTSAAAASIMRVGSWTGYWWLQGLLAEGEAARTTIEVGVLGFFLAYGPRFIIMAAALAITLRLRRPLFKCIAAATTVYLLLTFFASVINNPTGGLYFWFCAGLLYAMVRIEKFELQRSGMQGSESENLRRAQRPSYSGWRSR